jgi:hypothetical protein
MKFAITKAQHDELLLDQEKRIMRIVSIAMNDSLKHTPATHARSIMKVALEYAEICALLENTYAKYEPTIDGMNDL